MPNRIVGEARAGQASIRSSGGIPVLDETYHFLVEAESRFTSRIEVLTTPGLPVTNRSVSAYGFSVCKSKSATRREDQPRMWDVTCEFSSEVDESQDQQDPETDPEQWKPIYETKFERMEEIVTKDVDGDAIANSAGQPFENGLVRPRFIPVWEFFQFESATITDEQVIERNEVVNSTTFKGRAAKTLLLTVMSSVVGYYYGAPRRLTQYSLKYNVRNWRHKRLDVGTIYLNSGERKAYTDFEGNVILGGLNGAGGRVLAGAAPAVLEFDQYPSTDFSTFLRV